MTEVRELEDAELEQFAGIVRRSFPSFGLDDAALRERYVARLREQHRDPYAPYLGAWRAGRLLGGMRCHDFTMNLRGQQIAAAGIGMVAVDIAHKKTHVAHDMVVAFLARAQARGQHIAILYPFRPDFYLQMGFGYGARIHQYRLRLTALPDGGPRHGVRLLDVADTAAIEACYARTQARTNGLLARRPGEVRQIIADEQRTVVGYEADGTLRGYLVFLFRRGATFLTHDLDVRELVYDDHDALMALLGFVRRQADQCERMIWSTHDDAVHLLTDDPRDGSDEIIPHVFHRSSIAGVGLLYRVIEPRALAAACGTARFGAGTACVRFVIDDTLVPGIGGAVTVAFADGTLRPSAAPPDCEVRLSLAMFSSLLIGAARLERLVRYGRATLSDPAWLPLLDAILTSAEPPACTTLF